jgi:hypothetical protein
MRRAAVVFALGFALPGIAAAESAPASLGNLLNLRGARSQLRYTPGALDRAAHVQARLDTLAADFAAWSGKRFALQGYVLGPEDWAAADMTAAYGLPERTGPATVAVPAWGDERTVALWRDLLGGALPWGSGLPVRGTPEEAASLALSDVLLQSALAKLFLEGVGVSGDPGWVDEVLAQSVALAAFHLHEATRVPEIEHVYARLAESAASSASGLSHEARCFAAARIVVAKDGLRTPKRLLKLARAHGGRIGAGDLVARYPELSAWMSTAAPAPAGTR